MKFIELTLCTTDKKEISKVVINIDSIIRVDDRPTTRVWLKEFDDAMYVLESYNYLRFILIDNINNKKL